MTEAEYRAARTWANRRRLRSSTILYPFLLLFFLHLLLLRRFSLTPLHPLPCRIFNCSFSPPFPYVQHRAPKRESEIQARPFAKSSHPRPKLKAIPFSRPPLVLHFECRIFAEFSTSPSGRLRPSQLKFFHPSFPLSFSRSRTDFNERAFGLNICYNGSAIKTLQYGGSRLRLSKRDFVHCYILRALVDSYFTIDDDDFRVGAIVMFANSSQQ